MSKLRSMLRWRWIKALKVWDYVPIRAQGGILSLIPFIAILISFAVAFYGNQSRAWIEDDIQRKFKMVRQYNDLMSLMVDAETGERGFLLTKRPEYLEPYKKAVEQIPSTVASLRETVQLERGERPRLERLHGLAKIDELVSKQLDSLKASQDFVNGKSGDDLYSHLQAGKEYMDAIRAQIGAMQTKEEELLSERIEDTNWIRYRDYIFVFVALFVGMMSRLVSFYLFDRGIVRRIDKLKEAASTIVEGKPFSLQQSKKKDAIGLLEQEIAKIAEQREKLDTSDNKDT